MKKPNYEHSPVVAAMLARSVHETAVKNDNQPKSESQRLADLESIRMPGNSHLIDAAIKSGQTAGQVALGILNEQRESDNHANAIAGHINEMRHAQHHRPARTSQNDVSNNGATTNSYSELNLTPKEQEDAEGIISAMNELRKNGRN